MTVPARGRGKTNPLIIPVSVGNNLQLNKTFTGKSVVGLCEPGIGIPGNHIVRQNARIYWVVLRFWFKLHKSGFNNRNLIMSYTLYSFLQWSNIILVIYRWYWFLSRKIKIIFEWTATMKIHFTHAKRVNIAIYFCPPPLTLLSS